MKKQLFAVCTFLLLCVTSCIVYAGTTDNEPSIREELQKLQEKEALGFQDFKVFQEVFTEYYTFIFLPLEENGQRYPLVINQDTVGKNITDLNTYLHSGVATKENILKEFPAISEQFYLQFITDKSNQQYVLIIKPKQIRVQFESNVTEFQVLLDSKPLGTYKNGTYTYIKAGNSYTLSISADKHKTLKIPLDLKDYSQIERTEKIELQANTPWWLILIATISLITIIIWAWYRYKITSPHPLPPVDVPPVDVLPVDVQAVGLIQVRNRYYTEQDLLNRDYETIFQQESKRVKGILNSILYCITRECLPNIGYIETDEGEKLKKEVLRSLRSAESLEKELENIRETISVLVKSNPTSLDYVVSKLKEFSANITFISRKSMEMLMEVEEYSEQISFLKSNSLIERKNDKFQQYIFDDFKESLENMLQTIQVRNQGLENIKAVEHKIEQYHLQSAEKARNVEKMIHLLAKQVGHFMESRTDVTTLELNFLDLQTKMFNMAEGLQGLEDKIKGNDNIPESLDRSIETFQAKIGEMVEDTIQVFIENLREGLKGNAVTYNQFECIYKEIETKYSHISIISKDFLTTAECYYSTSRDSKIRDYSSIVLPYFKVIEHELYSHLSEKMGYKKTDTLGQMLHKLRNVRYWNSIVKQYNNEGLSDIRNKATHKEAVSRSECEKVRDSFFNNAGVLNKILNQSLSH